MKGKRFALLGVNTDAVRTVWEKESPRQGINWRSWWDGAVMGPVARAWEVQGLPYLYVLDHEGNIRHVNVLGPELDGRIEDLVNRADKEAVK